MRLARGAAASTNQSGTAERTNPEAFRQAASVVHVIAGNLAEEELRQKFLTSPAVREVLS